jgi:hypothetical protein
VVAGVLVPGFNVSPNNALGDGVDANDVPFLPYFPYVAPPHNPFSHTHDAPGAMPTLRVVNDVTGALRAATPEVESSDEETGAAAESAEDVLVPTHAGLSLAGSNPASRAMLRYTLTTPARVSLRIYDLQGRVVRTLVDQDAAAGSFQAEWDGYGDDGLRAGKGIYFARFTAGDRLTDSKKIVLE